MPRKTLIAAALIGAASSLAAAAAEYPIGEPQEGGGLEVAAVYLQPIVMEPAGMMTRRPRPTSIWRPISTRSAAMRTAWPRANGRPICRSASS